MAFLRGYIKNLIVQYIIHNQRLRDYFEYSVSEKGVLFFRQLEDHQLIYHPHDIIGKLLTEQGEYARSPVRLLSKSLPRLHDGTGDCWIIELGGNIGTHTVYFCREFAKIRVLTVEADPENVEILNTNIALNNLSDRVEVFSGAVSNFEGELELVRDFYNRGGTSVSGNVLADRSTPFSTSAITVDGLVKEYGIAPEKIGLVWIDVEGHEMEVLDGMKATLGSAPPLFFEYSPRDDARNRKIADTIFKRYENVFLLQGEFRQISREDFLKLSTGVDIFAVNK